MGLPNIASRVTCAQANVDRVSTCGIPSRCHQTIRSSGREDTRPNNASTMNPIFSYQSKLLGERPPEHARTGSGSMGGVRGQWEARVRESEKIQGAGSVGKRTSGEVSPLIASPSRREFRSEYLTTKTARVDGESECLSDSKVTDAMVDPADDLERATNLQATLAQLTGTDLPTSSDSEPADTDSPDLSPPRFLHHLAPDIESDLDKSRKSRAAMTADDDDEDDPLDLLGKRVGGGNVVRKRMSNPLLGEPYYPNPNPVRGWTERQRREGRGLAVFDEVGRVDRT